jgi:cell division protein FtsN
MKILNLLTVLIFVFILISCGAKKEKTDDLDSTANENLEGNIDTNVSYEEFVANGLGEDTNYVENTKSEKMVYISPTKEVQVDPPVDLKKEVVPVKKEIKEEVKAHEVRYYVVAGSFKSYSNAKNLSNFFQKKGYHPLILPKVNEYNRVAIVSYSIEADARKSLEKLRTENKDITFWLYKW